MRSSCSESLSLRLRSCWTRAHAKSAIIRQVFTKSDRRRSPNFLAVQSSDEDGAGGTGDRHNTFMEPTVLPVGPYAFDDGGFGTSSPPSSSPRKVAPAITFPVSTPRLSISHPINRVSRLELVTSFTPGVSVPATRCGSAG